MASERSRRGLPNGAEARDSGRRESSDRPAIAPRRRKRSAGERPPRASFAFQVLCDFFGAQQPFDVAALVEALVGEELELRGIFHADAVSDFALQESGVLAQG